MVFRKKGKNNPQIEYFYEENLRHQDLQSIHTPDFWVSAIEINLVFGQQNDINEPKKTQCEIMDMGDYY